nr:hypothetical protein [Achromobacter ruhlandii]
MILPRPRGKGRPWLALLLLFLLTATHAAPASNQADVELRTDISTMAVQITQGAPLPPGGCKSGYLWHTTYGGCRIAQTQSESAQCPAGYTGTRVRYRTVYVLQANSADVAYEGWGAWHDSCQALPPATVNFEMLKAPDALQCRSSEFRLRVTYPDGSRASGIALKWDARTGSVALPVTQTDGNGESSNWVTSFDNMQSVIEVSWGASMVKLLGVCIGGS